MVELLTQWEGLKRLFKSEDTPPPDLALALTSQGGFKVDIPIQLQALVSQHHPLASAKGFPSGRCSCLPC